MKKCTSCGAELSDAAVICRECGEGQPQSESNDSFFSMPYLSANVKPAVRSDAEEHTEEDKPAEKKTKKAKLSKEEIDSIIDPRERAFAKQDRRNRMVRITALIIAVLVLIGTAVYLFTRSTGYMRALDKYVDGRISNGTEYMDIVPEIYLIEAEDTYSMSRPDIRSTTKNYLATVKTQLEADFGSGLDCTYKVITERETDSETDLDTIEESLLSVYGIDISIDKAAYVSVKLTTKGSASQTTETMSLTFFEYEGKWYSMDAMEIVQFACVNAGYGLW